MDSQITLNKTPSGKTRQWVTLVIYVGTMILGAFIACLLFSDGDVLNAQVPDALPQFVMYVVLKVCACLSLGSSIVIFGCATRDALEECADGHFAGLMMSVSSHPMAPLARRIDGPFRPPRSFD